MEQMNVLIQSLQNESEKTSQISKTRCRKLLSQIQKQTKLARKELLQQRKEMKTSRAKKQKVVKPVAVRKKSKKGK